MLLGHIDDCWGLGELVLPRRALGKARPKENLFTILEQDDLETSSLRLPSRVQIDLDVAKAVAQSVADGDGLALEHLSGGAVDDVEAQLGVF